MTLKLDKRISTALGKRADELRSRIDKLQYEVAYVGKTEDFQHHLASENTINNNLTIARQALDAVKVKKQEERKNAIVTNPDVAHNSISAQFGAATTAYYNFPSSFLGYDTKTRASLERLVVNLNHDLAIACNEKRQFLKNYCQSRNVEINAITAELSNVLNVLADMAGVGRFAMDLECDPFECWKEEVE